MEQNQAIQHVRSRLEHARAVAVLTGAGISAESGVPTFRGDGGIWKQYNAMDLATPQAFARDPGLVWEFYHWRRELISKVNPNPAHYALADLEKIKPETTLITQNVDGLHGRAGSKNILEIHGNIWKVRCTKCGLNVENHDLDLPDLPLCTLCGGLRRPHVVWFGEALDPVLLNQALDSAKNCNVMLVIGTSAVVQPAASFALFAKESGAFVAEINLEETAASRRMDAVLTGPAGMIVPQLIQRPE
jgi:NAD-dependent deacetylase